MSNEALRDTVHPGPSDKSVSSSYALPHSPIEERHIDFVLEEEFACNPEFLTFFLKLARESAEKSKGVPTVDNDHSLLMQPHQEADCQSARSVTTDFGETDVLVTYQSAHATKSRVAILIEDKIRADFQELQPERYRDRGDTGEQAKSWDAYWTCLVAPKKYADGNHGFHIRISFEELVDFFSGADKRTKFKARVFEQALKKFDATRLQKRSETMTNFRAFYAKEAQAFFAEGEIKWDKARDAYFDDQWFSFRGGPFPAGIKIVYKAKKGAVELTYPETDVNLLKELLSSCPHDDRIIAAPIGEANASFSILVTKIPPAEFSDHAGVKARVLKSFEGVRSLIEFYKTNAAQITAALNR